jgi:hypothetical protein
MLNTGSVRSMLQDGGASGVAISKFAQQRFANESAGATNAASGTANRTASMEARLRMKRDMQQRISYAGKGSSGEIIDEFFQATSGGFGSDEDFKVASGDFAAKLQSKYGMSKQQASEVAGLLFSDRGDVNNKAALFGGETDAATAEHDTMSRIKGHVMRLDNEKGGLAESIKTLRDNAVTGEERTAADAALKGFGMIKESEAGDRMSKMVGYLYHQEFGGDGARGKRFKALQGQLSAAGVSSNIEDIEVDDKEREALIKKYGKNDADSIIRNAQEYERARRSIEQTAYEIGLDPKEWIEKAKNKSDMLEDKKKDGSAGGEGGSTTKADKVALTSENTVIQVSALHINGLNTGPATLSSRST